MSLSFDRVAACYDETRGGERCGREFAIDVLRWLAPGTVLEVGVGTGLVAASVAAAGTPVFGVDVSPEMAKRAYARLGPRLALGDARALPVRGACVDSVLFVMVLHVVVDVPAALAEAARVLRPGGRVVTIHAAPEPEGSDLTKASEPLEGVRVARPDDLAALTTAAAGAGLTALHEGWTSPYTVSRTPHQAADGVERKIWSYLWGLDEAAWEAHAVPAIRALRALPEPDRPRRTTQRHRLTVFEMV